MKNTTILKDELSILKSDTSAVKIELGNLGKELKEKHSEIEESEIRLADIKDEILLAIARRDEMHDRAILLKGECASASQELNAITIKLETARTKNALEERLHLGRIKEFDDQIEDKRIELKELKETYDKNTNAMNSNLSEANSKYKQLDKLILETSKELEKKRKEIENIREEEKKFTKERLKKEDKIRDREKAVERRERGIGKREEDVQKMASDLVVVYYRLKELYAKVDPKVDIDKLITKAI